jgi:CoA:oxalate CoA-transferase
MNASGPLDGVVVIDMTRVLAGPLCTLLLADLGARVIKIEAPGTGDDSRQFGPFVKGRSAYFAALNRGKESIALDLKTEADRAVFERLLARADVVVENFRAGTMERLGYGWEALHARFPRLIYAAASGFGHTGPYAGRASYDVIAQAMGGIMSITGQPGGPPTRVGTSIGDISAALFAAVGTLAALTYRHESGLGMKVDISMLDCQIAILENAITRYLATGEIPGPLGARHPTIAPFELFQAADGPIVIAAANDHLFGKLCAALGRGALPKDPRFGDNDSRSRNVADLKREIEAVLASRPKSEWLDILTEAGVPCGPINNVAEALADPQVAARNMLVTVEDPIMGRQRMPGNPIKLSAFLDPPTRPPAPELDADRDRILAELAEDVASS